MSTIGDSISEFWRQWVDEIWPAIGPGRTFSTYTARRLTATGAKDALGITPTTFSVVVSGQSCLLYGITSNDPRWQVENEGQDQKERVILWTTYLDTREGDEILLALDGKTYHVESSSYQGRLIKCVLTTAKARSG